MWIKAGMSYGKAGNYIGKGESGMNDILYDERKQFVLNEKAAINLRSSIEEIVDSICENGYSNIVMIGTGRSYCHALQLQYIANMISDVSFYAVRAIDYVFNGMDKVNQESVVIIESAQGDDEYLIEAVEMCRQKRCRIVGIINDSSSPLASMSDYLISFPVGSLYKRYYLLFRILNKSDMFDDYEEFCEMLEKVPDVCIQAGKRFMNNLAGTTAAIAGANNLFLIGDGIIWEQVNSYCMYSLEESLWIRSQSINIGDLFHGAIEVIDKNSTVIIFKGTDESSVLADRAYRYLTRICENVVMIDIAAYIPENAFGKYKKLLTPFVFKMIQNILNKSLEVEMRHPLSIRRYVGNLEF